MLQEDIKDKDKDQSKMSWMLQIRDKSQMPGGTKDGRKYKSKASLMLLAGILSIRAKWPGPTFIAGSTGCP